MSKICLPQNIYMVGIGGVSMSGIAQHLVSLGYHVSGSDRTENEYTAHLKKLGVQVQGECASVGGYDLVVHTSAVKHSHPQLVEAQKLGIPILLREQLLGEIFDSFPTRIAICGTHGKTTVTAMLHHVLQRCNIAHTAFIGGSYQGNNYFGGVNIVIAEACEYNSSFLHLHPTHTLCLNVEYDHPDCYGSLAEVEGAFGKFFAQSQRVIVPKSLQKLHPKALAYDDFVAKNVLSTSSCTTFDLYHKKHFVAKCKLPVIGAHNVTNAIAVVRLCHQLKLPLLQVCHALSTFGGVERRWTKVPYKCNLVCDYAHHPTEITATVNTAKAISKGRVLCIFQPHTYTRTQAFWQQFATCFLGTTVVYLPIYPAREVPITGVTSQNLAQLALSLGVDAHYCESFANAVEFVQTVATANDTILVLGAGDVVDIAKLFAD